AGRTADRAARILVEADALAEASAWPGPRAVRELEAALGARQRVELSDLTEPGAVDLGIQPWERPGQREAMADRIQGLHGENARIVLAAEGRGSLERAREVLAAKAIPADAFLAVVADVEEGFRFRPEPDGPTTLAL